VRGSATHRAYGFFVPSVHDIGGRAEYFTPVGYDPAEPPFHARWEERVFGMVSFLMTSLNKSVDEFRFRIEQLPEQQYFSPYFARWLAALETELQADGYLVPGEVDAKVAEMPSAAGRNGPRIQTKVVALVLRAVLRPRLPGWVCARVLPRMFGASRPTRDAAEFAVGDTVRVRARRDGHTRQPGYVTGKLGVVTAQHGAAILPDARAVHRREPPQHLYTVAFSGTELWGDEAEPGTEVRIDLYAPYLEAG